MHGRQETVNTVLFAGETQLGHAPHDFLFQFVLGLHLGLDEQVAVFFQQRRQFVAAQAATVEHGHRVAALIGQVLDQDEGKQ
ncbi:hypothetical protein D3C85_1057410 [compost metagenome]